MKSAIVFLSISILLASASKCKIPDAGIPIDWNKVSGFWYLALHDNDPVTSEDVLCARVEVLGTTENGLLFDVYNFFEKEKPYHFNVHFTRQSEPGIFRFDQESDAPIIEAGDFDPDGKLNKAALQYSLFMLNHDVFWYTDGEDILFIISCDINDSWMVWAYTRTPQPTHLEIENLKNKLSEYGVNEELYPARCEAAASDWGK